MDSSDKQIFGFFIVDRKPRGRYEPLFRHAQVVTSLLGQHGIDGPGDGSLGKPQVGRRWFHLGHDSLAPLRHFKRSNSNAPFPVSRSVNAEHRSLFRVVRARSQPPGFPFGNTPAITYQRCSGGLVRCMTDALPRQIIMFAQAPLP